MAKVIEQIIAIKFSKIVKDSDSDTNVISNDQMSMLSQSVTELAESIVDNSSIVVEVIDINS